MVLPGDVTYPLWGWGPDQTAELTGATVTGSQLSAAHRELERIVAHRVGVHSWSAELSGGWTSDDAAEWPYLAGYPSRRAWCEAVSWQAAWRADHPQQPDLDTDGRVAMERLGDHTVTYDHPVRVGGRNVAAEAYRSLAAAGLLAGRLAGRSR